LNKNLKIFCIIGVICSLSFAQKRDIQFNHLTSQDGLASNSVFSIVQDNKGFLWFGTYDGLNRYDGYKITAYKTIEGDTTSISDNKIRVISKDDKGNLWIGTWDSGLNKYDPITEKFTRYQHDANNLSSLSSNNIVSLFCDKYGNLWIGTIGGGLNGFDSKYNKFHCFKNNPDDPSSLSGNAIYSIYEDRNGTLWIGTSAGGLNKFNRESETFTSFKFNPADSKSISSNYVTSIFEDRTGNLWIGTATGGLNKFDRRSDKFDRYSKNSSTSILSNYIQSIFEDSEGTLWIGTDDAGLSVFNRQDEEFIWYRQSSNNPESLTDNTIVSICEDRTGILWFGTWNGGINKYSKIDKKFITISHNPDDPNSLSGNSIFPIYEDRFGDLWIGTDIKGLNRINKKTNKFTRYFNQPDDPNSISSNSINSICEDSFGNLWISTNDNGINRFDRTTNKFAHFKNIPNDPSSIRNNAISQMFLDSKGDLWIGVSNAGLDKLVKGSTGFIHYEPDPKNPKSISPQTIFAINEDQSGNLWVGSDGGGLSMLDKDKEEFIHFKNDPGNSFSLSHNSVSVIHRDKNGTLWIGTNGGGLNKYNPKDKAFIRFREKDGLPNEMICGILEDDAGNLWISTYKGLSRFDPQNENFRNFGVEDGLQGNEFNNWAFCKSKNGTMYFGGTDGVSFFHPDSLKDNLVIPPVVITDFQLLHKPVQIGYDPNWERTILQTSIAETKQIDLKYDDNIISLEFSALDFNNPERNQYIYILEGFDKNWTRTTAKRRFVTYTNLDPGEYTFRVKGSNNDEIWNEAGTSLKIIIHPPWWATWWSYILYGFVSILIFASSTRFYLNRQRLRTQLDLEQVHAKKLEEVDRMKSNFYANISHEFRTPLMLILGPVEKLISKVKDEDSQKQAGLIKGNAKRLLTLINQLLDLSRLEAGKLKLNASKGNIAQFVKGLAMEFESIAERKDISLKVLMEKEDVEAYFDKEKLEKIITNLMSNAFKFTPSGGRITVKLSETSTNQVEIIIRDSGIGIPQSELSKIFDRFYQVDGSHTREHEGTGIGLALTKELVELHKGNIFVDSVEGHWTEVKLNFPLGREHLTDAEIIATADFEMRKVENVDEFTKEDSEAGDLLNDNLIDKTIVLVVEDNPDVREYIKDALKEYYHVEEAANGEQGLRKAEKCIPDLIISDIMMPKMDGYEMTRRIRQDEKTSHIPIILLTAKSDKDSRLEGLGLGADDYLIKPFDSDELLARIKNLIETRRRLQEKFGTGAAILQKPEKANLSCLDEQFMNRIMMVVDEHLAEEEFSIEEFGKDVGMSRSQMHRKLKALTGKSASVYLRTVRLAKAKQMIEEKKGTISEISYWVGFASPAYFSRCFKDEFGFTPSEVSK
jgi:signal transduction histidine kinase/ligand-binding sensor domain-containing protein/DNA-binding response OmpR family regulator